MADKICSICKLALPATVNGNRKYHSHCAPQNKKNKNRSRYSRIKEMDKEALRLDRILQYFFLHSQGKESIDRSLLDRSMFRWDFIIKIVGNPPVFWILEYGYSYTDNKKKIIVHNGNKSI